MDEKLIDVGNQFCIYMVDDAGGEWFLGEYSSGCDWFLFTTKTIQDICFADVEHIKRLAESEEFRHLVHDCNIVHHEIGSIKLCFKYNLSET
jgi:hypothetical protein